MKNVTFKKLATALFLTVSFIPAYAQEGMATPDIPGDLQRFYEAADQAGTACDAQSEATDAQVMEHLRKATSAIAKIAADCKTAGIDGDPIIARLPVVADEYQQAMDAGDKRDFETLREMVKKAGERFCRLVNYHQLEQKIKAALASHPRPLAGHSDQPADE